MSSVIVKEILSIEVNTMISTKICNYSYFGQDSPSFTSKGILSLLSFISINLLSKGLVIEKREDVLQIMLVHFYLLQATYLLVHPLNMDRLLLRHLFSSLLSNYKTII